MGLRGRRSDGTGQTIAIIDAYHDPDITTDLHTFDTQYGLAGSDADAD